MAAAAVQRVSFSEDAESLLIAVKELLLYFCVGRSFNLSLSL